jgi:ABC-2 type transport system permease protein
MGGLIKAEFRKVLTLNLWWAMLIPTVLVAFGISFLWGKLTNELASYLGGSDTRQLAALLGIDAEAMPVGMFGLSHGINFATLFPMVFGVLALAGEHQRKTITTTFLTASSRFQVLSAKMITYVTWGVLYGVVAGAAASLAILVAVDSERLPDSSQWLALFGAGILAMILVTLFGIGVGAVMNSVVGAIIVLMLWMPLAENLLVLFLFTKVPAIGAVLPNATANGILGGITADAFGADEATSLLTGADETLRYALQFAAGAPGVSSWWASSLVFGAWTMVFFITGWLVNQKRDIT